MRFHSANLQIASTPEMDLLLALLGRASASGDDELRGKLLESKTIDWKLWLESILWHGVPALVGRRLRSSGGYRLLPEEINAQLQCVIANQTARSIVQVAALNEIQQAAEKAGVRLVAWKGPTLSALLYDNFSLRDSCDLDFLIERSQLSAIESILIAKDFKVDIVGETDAVAACFCDFFCEVKLSRERDRIHVELHDEIMPRPYICGQSMQGCLGRSVWQRLNSTVQVRTLALEDLLLSLCLHGSKHYWERLKWLCDIASLMERYSSSIRWAQLIQRAREESSLRPLLNGILLSQHLLGSQVPASIHEAAIRDTAVNALLDEQEEWVRSGRRSHRQNKSLASVSASHLLAGRRERAVYLLRKLFIIAPSDVALIRLPDKLHLLYYPVRWMRLGGIACCSLAQALDGFLGRKLASRTRLYRVVKHASFRQWPLLFEATGALLLASCGLKIMHLQTLTQVGHRAFRRNVGKPLKLNEPQHIASTINRVARVIPGAKCLSRALAMQWILGRRGTDGIVHIGVAKSTNQAFQSHAWMTVHGIVLIGGMSSPEHYREIVCLSPNQEKVS